MDDRLSRLRRWRHRGRRLRRHRRFEGVYAGTNTGAFGPFPATGRSVSLPWINVLRFDSDGRIIGGGAYYDQLTVMTQLGHMEPPAGA